MIFIQSVVTPDYYTKFVCLMGECPHPCCQSWGVEVEPSEYEFLLSKGVTDDFFKVFGVGESCEIELNMENGICKFRRPDGLCSVQCSYGEEKLFATCRAFPRSFAKISHGFEAALDPSCPAVSKIILSMDELKLSSLMEEIPYLDIEIDNEKISSCFESPTDFALFRAFCNTLILCQSLSFFEALVLIGIFTEQCNFPISHENFIHLVEKWSEYTENNYASILDSIAKDEAFKCEFFHSLYSLFLLENENLFGIDVSSTYGSPDETDSFAANSDSKVKNPVLNQNHLKSLLSNLLFLEKYPFSLSEPSAPANRAFRRLALSLSFFVFIAERTALELDKTLYLYTRAVEHDVDFLSNALDEIEDLGLWNLELFSALIL